MIFSDTLYGDLGLSRMDRVLMLEQGKLMHKIILQKQKSNTNITFNNEIHSHKTRNNNNVYANSNRTNLGLYSQIQCASKLYNSLPENLKLLKNYNVFLQKLRIFLEIK